MADAYRKAIFWLSLEWQSTTLWHNFLLLTNNCKKHSELWQQLFLNTVKMQNFLSLAKVHILTIWKLFFTFYWREEFLMRKNNLETLFIISTFDKYLTSFKLLNVTIATSRNYHPGVRFKNSKTLLSYFLIGNLTV